MSRECLPSAINSARSNICGESERGKLEGGDAIGLTERIATIMCSCCVSLMAPLVRVEMYETLEISAVENAQEVVIAAARTLHAQPSRVTLGFCQVGLVGTPVQLP